MVSYDRFILFLERLRQELLGLAPPAAMDIDLDNETRRTAAAMRSGRQARGGGVSDNPVKSNEEYVASLKDVLLQTEDWETMTPAERERAMNLLRIHKAEAERRRGQYGDVSVPQFYQRLG